MVPLLILILRRWLLFDDHQLTELRLHHTGALLGLVATSRVLVGPASLRSGAGGANRLVGGLSLDETAVERGFRSQLDLERLSPSHTVQLRQ